MDAPKATPAYRLILTLTVAGLLSGLIIVSLYEGTRPRILAQQARALQAAVLEVLPGAVSMRPLLEGPEGWRPAAESPAAGGERGPQGGEVAGDGPAGVGNGEDAGGEAAAVDGKPAPLGARAFAAYDEAGQLVGYAFEGEGAGFQDVIRLLYGFDPESRRVVGMRILESRETPGLGDKIYKDADFVANFEALAVDPALVLVKGGGSGAPNEVHAITGATISSRAVVQIVQATQSRWDEQLLRKEGSAPAGVSAPVGASVPDGASPPVGASVPDGASPPVGASVRDGVSPPSGASVPDGASPSLGASVRDRASPPVGASLPDGISVPGGASVPEGSGQATGKRDGGDDGA